jgi:cbb3-type cytochrome oxidase subunit 3
MRAGILVSRSSKKQIHIRMKDVAGTLVFLIVVLAGVWFLPTWWRDRQAVKSNQPSITALRDEVVQAVSAEADRVTQAVEEKSSEVITSVPVKTTDTAKLSLKVLNGGAVKGSAGKAVQTLKSAGYALAVQGDAKGDYTGVTVYYREGSQADAEQVKQALIKDYPNATTQIVTDSKHETALTPVVVMLGK